MKEEKQDKLQTLSSLPKSTKKPLRKSKSLKKESSESPQILTVPAEAIPAAIDVEKAQEVIFQPNPGPQTDFLSAGEQEVMYGGAAGGGKAQPLTSIVETPDGPKLMGDISVGDIVCTPNGGTAKVVQEHPQGLVDTYAVQFQDGTTVECTLDHLWYCKPVRDGSTRWKVRSLKEIIDSGRSYVVPLSYVDYKPKKFKISPYAMGSLLGDGGLTTNSVSFTTSDKESIAELKKEGLTLTKRSGKYAYGVIGLNKTLRKLGLLGTSSHTKFIPDQYLLGSFEQRLSLLQGLLDTDGYATKGGKVNYTSMSPVLLEQVAKLVRSLGGTATRMRGHTLYIRHPKTWTLFRLSRKVEKCTKSRTINNKIVGISYAGKKVCKCISIDSKEQLYITDGYIVTHNSYAMLADPVRNFSNPHAKQLLVRRSTEELRELISVSKQLYPRAIPGIKWLERDKTWVAPSGATLWMSYLDADDDVLRYQGQAYTWIGFDELTQWPTPYAWNYLRSRLRTSSSTGLKLYQRATTNPGGPGHHWVKKMFVDPAPPGQAFWAQDPETGQVITFPKGHSKEGQPLFKRRFIPATLFDNPYLSEDGMYEANLLSMPEHQRKQLLEGNWDVNEGAAFPEFNRHLHVCESFDIPHSWTKFRSADYGYGSHTGVLWFAVAPTGQVFVYRELYVSKVTAEDLAEMILEIEYDDNIRYGVLDSSLWHNRGDRGPSLAEQMIKKGCRWRPADRSRGSRVAGKNKIHQMLKVDPYSGEPLLQIFDTCTNLISQLPSVPLDKSNPEDVDTKTEDHLYDALRYGVMTRPRSHIFDYDPASSRTGFQMSDPTFGY